MYNNHRKHVLIIPTLCAQWCPRALSDLYVTCQLVADNKPLTIPFRTSFKAFTKDYTYESNIHDAITSSHLFVYVPQMERMDHISHSILRPAAQLPDHVHRMGYSGPTRRRSSRRLYLPFVRKELVSTRGSAPVPLMPTSTLRDCRTLRRGKHRLYLWPDREADGSNDTSTPSKTGTRDEMGRLEKVCHHRAVAPVYALTCYYIAREEIRAWRPSQVGLVGYYGFSEDGRDTCREYICYCARNIHADSLYCFQAETEKSENLFLYIDLPRFDFPVIFSEIVRVA